MLSPLGIGVLYGKKEIAERHRHRFEYNGRRYDRICL